MHKKRDVLAQLIDQLLANDIAIMSLGSGSSAFPPLKKLHEAVAVGSAECRLLYAVISCHVSTLGGSENLELLSF